jgi:hypothetical protein
VADCRLNAEVGLEKHVPNRPFERDSGSRFQRRSHRSLSITIWHDARVKVMYVQTIGEKNLPL